MFFLSSLLKWPFPFLMNMRMFTAGCPTEFQGLRLQEFSILDTFKRCKTFAKRLTREQHLTLQYHGTHPSLVAWPLGFPWWEYIKKAKLMRVNIQDLAEDGLDSDDEWMQPGTVGTAGTGQAAAGQVSPFGLTPLPRGVPNFGTM